MNSPAEAEGAGRIMVSRSVYSEFMVRRIFAVIFAPPLAIS
jgi:hypothetical protein